MSDLSGNRISFSAEDNINQDKIIRLESELTDLKAKYQKAVEHIKKVSELLDGIEYELYASVYTLTDDEFGTVFYCRDISDLLLKELGEKE